MHSKIITTLVAISVVFVVGCSGLNRMVYRPDIQQGNYLTESNVSKLQKGMTKEQVSFLLGTPMLKDPYGTDKWIYVFRQQTGHQQPEQETLKLTFDKEGKLLAINKQ